MREHIGLFFLNHLRTATGIYPEILWRSDLIFKTRPGNLDNARPSCVCNKTQKNETTAKKVDDSNKKLPKKLRFRGQGAVIPSFNKKSMSICGNIFKKMPSWVKIFIILLHTKGQAAAIPSFNKKSTSICGKFFKKMPSWVKIFIILLYTWGQGAAITSFNKKYMSW